MNTSPEFIQVENLSVHYKDKNGKLVRAVEDVSFTVRPGQTIAVIGESGSGKSSLSHAICGLVPAAAGRIAMDGAASGAHTPEAAGRWGVQLVHQNPMSALDPRWPVWRSVAEPIRRREGYEKGTGRELASAVLDRVGIARDLHGHRPSQLSGGQCQRANIARAIAAKPKIIILDEAVSALDVTVKAEILNLLISLKEEEGLTYLFVTHDMSVVAKMATDVLVMKNGKCVEEGTAAEIIFSPHDPYTRELIDAIPKF